MIVATLPVFCAAAYGAVKITPRNPSKENHYVSYALCLGHSYPRNPHLTFDEACKIL